MRYCVVGGGIVGVSTALEIQRLHPDADVELLESHRELAGEQTGHNSGVVHAGVYYTPGSLKATFCKDGAEWTKNYCRERGLPYEKVGKLIVASTPVEVERLKELMTRCRKNGISFERVSKDKIPEIEPSVVGLDAILVHDTAITDYRKITESLAKDFIGLGGRVVLGVKVDHLTETPDNVLVYGADDKKVPYLKWFDKVVVCAGIQTDTIMRKSGLTVDWRMIPFRGEYYRVTDPGVKLNHLIYPVPDPDLPFLGVHLTKMVDGSITVGPNAVLGLSKSRYGKLAVSPRDLLHTVSFPGFWKVAKSNLKTGVVEQWASLVKSAYAKRVQKYAPGVKAKVLTDYPCGIRAQAVERNGELIEDFRVSSTERVSYLVNAPSPAATSAHPIGVYLAANI